MEDAAFGVGFFCGGALIGIAVLCMNGCMANVAVEHNDAVWRAECITRGLAHYTTDTGEWQWKMNPEATENK